MNTDHRLQDGILQIEISQHAVGRGLFAVWLVQLGSPDVRRPPNAGQQAGRSAHRIVAWTGHLFVPCLCRTAGDEKRDHRDEEHEFDVHLHVQHLGLSVRNLCVSNGSVFYHGSLFVPSALHSTYRTSWSRSQYRQQKVPGLVDSHSTEKSLWNY